ncbi:hypothetical protein [Silvibacterium dinghuense]|uniref:Uncharacterized protein n=1 Tax=Silvibacterium dinghuense TaxID=1560006 RepID=A0A4V1NVA8_9BACT|nr:hypothetical protein [Silvibacterium dinghuense]RXS95120.1 hypothetical protein ESZ00_10945 [Silvibacterium dinghuense]GGH10806.1 hypothetical protein GCM10011586_29300 [Silvibacterium dinghuense]
MASNDTSEMILAELRELRSTYNDWAQEVAGRLAALETDMKSVVGNGRKGRLESIEEDLENIKNWRWRIAGISTGVSTVLSIIGFLLFHH